MPEKVKPAADELKNRIAEALAARDAGDPDAAVRRLEALLARGEHVPTLAGTIGDILLNKVDAPERAIPYLQWTVILSPRSERASLNLRRALIATKRMQLAADEEQRYLAARVPEPPLSATPAASDRGLPQRARQPGGRPQAGRSQDNGPRLAVVLIVETSCFADPYATLHKGLVEIRNRLRVTEGMLERLDLYLVTFAGRVWSITRLKYLGEGGTKSLGAAGRSGFDLRRHGLISALARGTRAAGLKLAHLRARGIPCLRPWLAMLVGGEIDEERRRLLAECEGMLRPLRRSGLNLFPVQGTCGGERATSFSLDGVAALQMQDPAMPDFFAWLAENLERVLLANGPGTNVQLTPPRWARRD